jgi:hypothetical protein
MAYGTLKGMPPAAFAPPELSAAEADLTGFVLSPLMSEVDLDAVALPEDSFQEWDDLQRYQEITAGAEAAGAGGLFAHAAVKPPSEKIRRLAELTEQLVSAEEEAYKPAARDIARLTKNLSPEDRLPAAHLLLGVYRKSMTKTKVADVCFRRMVPSLASGESLALLEHIALDGHFRVIDHVQRMLPALLAPLSAPERQSAAAWAKGWMRSSNEDVRFWGYRVVRTLAEQSPQEMDWPSEIRSLLADPNANVVQQAAYIAVEFFGGAGRTDDLLAIARTFESRLTDPNARIRATAVKVLGALFPALAPEHRPDRFSRILAMIEDDDEWVSREAVKFFDQPGIAKALRLEEKLGAVKKLQALLYAKDYVARQIQRDVERTMRHLIPLLPRDDQLDPLRALLDRAHDIGGIANIIGAFEPHDQLDAIELIEENFRRYSSSEAFSELAESLALLTGKDLLEHAFRLYAFQRTPPHPLSISVGHYSRIWDRVISLLDPEQRISFATMIEQQMGRRGKLSADKMLEERWQGSDSILDKIISSLRRHERLALIAHVLADKKGDPAGVSRDFLDILCKRLAPDMLADFAEKRGDSGLRAIARYHARHLPFDDHFWPQYLASSRPALFVSKISQEVAAYRTGEVTAFASERDLRLAFASLDSPDGLSFEDFSFWMQKTTPLPPPFLDRSFAARVREIRSAHLAVDKGKVKQALAPMTAVRDVGAFQQYLEALIKRENGSLKRIREDLTAAFPNGIGTLRMDELVASARNLLARIWPKRSTPPVQNLIVHLAFLIAWHRGESQGLTAKMSAARGEKIPSDTLFDALAATEEFYRDAMEDVIRESTKGAGSGTEIPPLRKQRELLAAELARAHGESGEEVDVAFLASKRPTDRFFGYVGEDCMKYKGWAIERPDFQVYRMLSGGRLAGMLYLQEAVLDGKKILVLALQPRSSWEIDQAHLLSVVERELSRIGEAHGYDAVVLMDDDNQQSNRLDMLKAIKARNYEKIAFSEGVSGAVFKGNEFLVVWKRS